MREIGRGRRVAGRVLRIAALAWSILFTVAFSLFAAGYASEDPGGLEAVGLVALWVVPLAVLVAVALLRPAAAWWILLALVGVAVLVAGWQLVDPRSLRDWEFEHGPVTAIASYVPLVPLALVGRSRPLSAALMLLAVGVAPILAELRVAPFHMGSTQAVAVPMALTGVVLLVAALLDPHPRRREA
jgi:hypothetical protein